MVAPLVLAGVGAGISLVGGLSTARKARAAGREQAKFIRMETDETVRRMQLTNSMQMKQARGAGYASGIQMSGSNEQYIRTMQTELARELAWTKKAGYQAAKAAKRGANVNFQASAIGSAVGALGQVSNAVSAWYGK
jgi:hypothetical protein